MFNTTAYVVRIQSRLSVHRGSLAHYALGKAGGTPPPSLPGKDQVQRCPLDQEGLVRKEPPNPSKIRLRTSPPPPPASRQEEYRQVCVGMLMKSVSELESCSSSLCKTCFQWLVNNNKLLYIMKIKIQLNTCLHSSLQTGVTACSHCPSDFSLPIPIFYQILCNMQKVFILVRFRF